MTMETGLKATTRSGKSFDVVYTESGPAIRVDGDVHSVALASDENGQYVRLGEELTMNLFGVRMPKGCAIQIYREDGQKAGPADVGRARAKAQSQINEVRLERGTEQLRAMGSEMLHFSLRTWAFCSLKGDAGFAAERLVKKWLGTDYFTWNRRGDDSAPYASVPADQFLRDVEASRQEAERLDAEARAEGYASAADKAENKDRSIRSLIGL